jgi:acetyl esterase/lipase
LPGARRRAAGLSRAATLRPRCLAVGLAAALVSCAHDTPLTEAAESFWRYRYTYDVVYRTVGNWQGTLDVMAPRDTARAWPAVVAIHGGGFATGSKEEFLPFALPYVARQWVVVNVGYRLAKDAPAPAAVEDVRCALRWVGEHARTYGIDPRRVVVTGYSAGGHLALMAAFLPDSSSFDRGCPGSFLHPAAVVNWAGITDLADWSRRTSSSARWLGEDRGDLARLLSPLTWVRPGVPPVITVHGDADRSVPHDHALRLHAALSAAEVPNELVTIPGGRHTYTSAPARQAMERVERFLDRHARATR